MQVKNYSAPYRYGFGNTTTRPPANNEQIATPKTNDSSVKKALIYGGAGALLLGSMIYFVKKKKLPDNYPFEHFIKETKNTKIIELEEKLKKDLKLERITLGDDESYAEELANELRSIQEKKLANLEGLNILTTDKLEKGLNGCCYAEAKTIVLSSELPLIHGLEIVNSLNKFRTIYHEIGHYEGYRLAPKLFKSTEKLPENETTPFGLPLEVRGIKIKARVDDFLTSTLRELKSTKNISYKKNEYLDEILADIFAWKHAPVQIAQQQNHQEKMASLEKNHNISKLYDALISDNQNTLAKSIIEATFSEKNYNSKLKNITGIERQAFIEEIMQKTAF